MAHSKVAALAGLGFLVSAQLAERATVSLAAAGLFFLGSLCELAALVLIFRERSESKSIDTPIAPWARGDDNLEAPDNLSRRER